jgi:hypothetical protein
MALPLGSAAKVVTFGGFKRCVTSFRMQTWHFDNVSKVVLRDRCNAFARFSEDELHFSRQAQHFGDLHRHFAWQAQHFRRVVLRVFCESHCQACVKW